MGIAIIFGVIYIVDETSRTDNASLRIKTDDKDSLFGADVVSIEYGDTVPVVEDSLSADSIVEDSMALLPVDEGANTGESTVSAEESEAASAEVTE